MPTTLRVVLAAVLVAALAPPAAAAPKKNPKSPQETAAYWTTERMKAAKPRERAKPGGGGGGGGGGKPSDWSRYSVPLAGGGYAGENAKNGKLFMTIDGGNYVCSGTAVDAGAGVSLVWTAGHCITDGPGHEATNVMFAPGYYNGATPNGEWTYEELDSTPGWEAQGADRFRYDVGAVRVVNSANPAATLSATVGTRPILFGQNPTGERVVSYGYPAAGKFSGMQQYACASPFRRWDTATLLDPMQISCDMSGGSSGGGWFLDTNDNSVGDAGEPLVSVNSYGYSFEKATMYGPYMPATGEAKQLYDRMR